MEFRVISLPPFTATSSGVGTAFDFSENGRLGKFDHYFSALHPAPRDAFMPRDFLYFDEQRQGMVWLWPSAAIWTRAALKRSISRAAFT